MWLSMLTAVKAIATVNVVHNLVPIILLITLLFQLQLVHYMSINALYGEIKQLLELSVYILWGYY